jgi:hypothetical protein
MDWHRNWVDMLFILINPSALRGRSLRRSNCQNRPRGKVRRLRGFQMLRCVLYCCTLLIFVYFFNSYRPIARHVVVESLIITLRASISATLCFFSRVLSRHQYFPIGVHWTQCSRWSILCLGAFSTVHMLSFSFSIIVSLVPSSNHQDIRFVWDDLDRMRGLRLFSRLVAWPCRSCTAFHSDLPAVQRCMYPSRTSFFIHCVYLR